MNVILDEREVGLAIERLASAICESVDVRNLYIVGIHTGGVHLARRIQVRIEATKGIRPPCGSLDITLYRDDLFEGLSKPIVGETCLPESVERRDIVLVDDVLFTGRTVRSALIELMDYGRPKRVQLAVLVDRGHRELPIHADFIAQTINTTEEETVQVYLREVNGVSNDQVAVIKRGQYAFGS